MARWDGVEEFIHVVDAGSFTAAANELGVSKSFVSKQIGLLEARLGARLLQRTTRNQSLTPIGELFFKQCKEMSALFDEAEASVSEMQESPSGKLRIAINNAYGVDYMATAIAEFTSQYDELVIEVMTSMKDVDLVAEGYDLAIRYGHQEDSSLYAKRIGYHSFCLCAAPEYFEAHGAPRNITELKEHNCLSGFQGDWQFNHNSGSLKVKVDGNWKSDDGAAVLAAARKGLGLAQLPISFILNDLQSGKLVPINDEWALFDREVWAVYGYSRNLAVKVRLFLDFLTKRFEPRKLRTWDVMPGSGIKPSIVRGNAGK